MPKWRLVSSIATSYISVLLLVVNILIVLNGLNLNRFIIIPSKDTDFQSSKQEIYLNRFNFRADSIANLENIQQLSVYSLNDRKTQSLPSRLAKSFGVS